MNVYKVIKYVEAEDLKSVLKKEKNEPVEEVIIIAETDREESNKVGYGG